MSTTSSTKKVQTCKRTNEDLFASAEIWDNDNFMCLSSEDEDDSDEDTGEVLVVRVQKKRQATTTSTEYVGSNTDIPVDDIQVVKVTPPKKKKVKVGRDGVRRTEVLMVSNKKTNGEEEEEESEEDIGKEVDYHLIKTLLCNDGSNLLIRIPGGYTEHWKCPVYVNMLHRSLYYEIKTWCEAIKDFVKNSDDKMERIGLEQKFDARQGEHIMSFVDTMERLVLHKLLKRRSIVLHSMHYEGLMHALPGTTKEMAKLVYNFCRSKSFHVRLMMMQGGGAICCDIGTLFSAGWEWQFGQFDDMEFLS